MAESFRIAPPPDDDPPDWWPRFFGVRQRRLRVLLLRHLARGEMSRVQLGQYVTAYDRLELDLALDDLEASGVIRSERREVAKCHGSRVGMPAVYYTLIGEKGEAV